MRPWSRLGRAARRALPACCVGGHGCTWGWSWCAQPHGLSPAANVVKECWEEAGIPRDLAARAVPVGAVSYEALVAEGIKRDVLFCYDLELPGDFVPEPQVGRPCTCAARACGWLEQVW